MTEGVPVFPWADDLGDKPLDAFIADLWGATGHGDGRDALAAVRQVVAAYRPPPLPCPLSPRELDIMVQLASGETKESAARNLGIAVDSVRSRCPQIYARLGARNVTQATAILVHHDWLPGLKMPQPVEPAPAIPRGSISWNRVYSERAAELRQRPGVPLEIGPYESQNGARGAVRSIRKGHFEAFQPAGAFDAETVRIDGGRWAVRACYLPVPAEERAAS